MDWVLQLLESEKRKLEKELSENNLMQRDMKKARLYMIGISQIKQAVKMISARIKSKTLSCDTGK